MPLPPEPQREHPSTYVVQDRSNQEELSRLQIQDHLFTASMGGALADQPDATVLPFLHKWVQVPDDYEEIYQQMLREMQQPDFVATLDLLTVWGHPKD